MCFCHISDELKSHQCKNFALYSPSNFLVNFQCCCKKYRRRCRKLWISKLLFMYLDLGSLRWTSCLLLTTFKLSLICSQKVTYSLLFHHLTWNHASETHNQCAGTLSVLLSMFLLLKDDVTSMLNWACLFQLLGSLWKIVFWIVTLNHAKGLLKTRFVFLNSLFDVNHLLIILFTL